MRTDLADTTKRFLKGFSVEGCIGVSLTMRQSANGVPLDEIRCAQNLNHFLNCLNTRVYGKRFKRFGERLRTIAALEYSHEERLHYHLILEKPSHMTTFAYKALIHELWNQTTFGYRQIHVHAQVDTGWTDYLTKFRAPKDQIDWENFYWD